MIERERVTCCLFVWVRCAEIQPGDVVLDPLCGGGSISIEVSELTLHWNSSNPDSNSNPDSKWDKSREVALLNYMQEQLEKCVLIKEVLERGSTITSRLCPFLFLLLSFYSLPLLLSLLTGISSMARDASHCRRYPPLGGTACCSQH